MKRWFHKSVVKLIDESKNLDPIDEIRARSRNLVIKALEKGWSGPPFNVIELSKLLNIDIAPNDNVLDARISKHKKKFLIEYNPFQKPTRINFSIAHEIAHSLFSDWDEEIRNREVEPTVNRELEQLCNIAASEIQLPYAVFSNDANSHKEITLEGLIDLATKYKASLESLFIRFVEVIDKPCAILICSFRENDKLVVEYSKGSSSFGISIPANFIIPKNSKAYECSAPGWSARETAHWSFLDNQYDIYSIGISPMRRDKFARVGILITTNNKEVLQERRIRTEFGDASKPRGEGVKILAQIVNTSGGLGLGFGKALSKNYPKVKTALENWRKDKGSFKLGSSQLVQISNELYIFQMLAQKGLFEKNGEIPLKYSSLRECLIDLRSECYRLGASVHMPLIGAGQAKGDWNVIQGIIYDELVNKDINVNIYMLPGKVPNLKTKSNLSLFDEKSTWLKKK